jgi:hypothetical protein
MVKKNLESVEIGWCAVKCQTVTSLAKLEAEVQARHVMTHGRTVLARRPILVKDFTSAIWEFSFLSHHRSVSRDPDVPFGCCRSISATVRHLMGTSFAMEQVRSTDLRENVAHTL